MQREGSSNASSKIRSESQPTLSRFSVVTAATPAKRIIFFKSGDPQFRGVRMAIHKRSFKCFDALLDDLSQKVPLPFGVRTITTPKGTHLIQHLDQLEDGRCYLCSDRHHVKPINMEIAGKKPVIWHTSHPHNSRRKPFRPEEKHMGHFSHHYIRNPKRIILIKNNDPAVRRSIVLTRRMTRSLRSFIEEISALMQCHVRKLYTLGGRKIDSIQSLMQCPSVLLCVGRESFKPLLMENMQKHSEEKLPGLGTRSHSSICSESHEGKKNVNFGLETKKSIIHPRSDSSNKSTRFSLFSDKSFPNGSGIAPEDSSWDTNEVILNDDIEKRVVVNKDGSLSVQMKVHFRLVNDETLQWSTEIKKMAPTANEDLPSKSGVPQYVPNKANHSDPDSSACEPEETCTPNLHQEHLKESCCHSCCSHSQGFDIWKNPIHKNNGTRSCCSSSNSSHKMMLQRTSVDSVLTNSRSSEEYTEHVAEKASCFQETVEEQEMRIEYCSISRCCSQSEVSATATKLNVSTDDSCESNTGYDDVTRKPNFNLIKEQSVSKISNSKKVYESLKKNQYADYDYSPNSFECSQSDNPEQSNQCTYVHCYGGHTLQNFHLSPAPPSKTFNCSSHVLKNKKYRCVFRAPEVPHEQEDHGDVRKDSVRSSVYSKSPCFHCRQPSPGLVVFNESRATKNSHNAAVSNMNSTQEVSEERKENGNRSICATSADMGLSGKSTKSTCCAGCEIFPVPSENLLDTQTEAADEEDKSQKSCASTLSERSCASHRDSNIPVQSIAEVEVKQPACKSVMSDISDLSATSKQSNKSNRTAYESSECMNVDERSKSAMTVKSNASTKSKTNSVKPNTVTQSVLENQDVDGFGTVQVIQNIKTDLNKTEMNDTNKGLNRTSRDSHSPKESEKLHLSKNSIQCLSLSPETFQVNKDPKRSPSAMSKNSMTSLKSNPCSVSKSLLNPTDASTGSDYRPAVKSPDSLAVTSSSPKMKKRFPTPGPPKVISAVNTNRAKSVTSTTSTKSAKSSKCHCCPNGKNVVSDICVRRVANSPSEKSISAHFFSPSPYDQLDQPLSPTSTASVSLGLGEEENEGSMSSVSQMLLDDRCLPEQPTPEHSADYADKNLEIVCRDQIKTATSTHSHISDRSKGSNFLEDPCTIKFTVQAAEPESIMSTTVNQESMTEVLLNDRNHKVLSALSGSSEESTCRASQLSEGSLPITMSESITEAVVELNKTETHKALSGNSSKSGRAARTAKDTNHDTTKTKTQPTCNLEIKQTKKSVSYTDTESLSSFKTSQSDKKPCEQKEQSLRQNSLANSVSQNCASVEIKTANKNLSETHLMSSGGTLTKKKPANSRPESGESRSNTTNSINKQRKITQISNHKGEDCGHNQLLPSSLPNTSPTEVVNHWLRNIPADGPMYEIEDEFNEKQDEPVLYIPAIQTEESLHNKTEEQSEVLSKFNESQKDMLHEGAGQFMENKSIISDKTQTSTAANTDLSLPQKLNKREGFSNHYQPSIQVMKLLLNPKLDRCNSLPEVSPTYARKLSTSAKGLLDCLIHLQVIDSYSKKDKDDKLNDIISNLQSLWFSEQYEHKIKDHRSAKDEFNPKSSSEVDLSSDAKGSRKGSISGIIEKSERITYITKQSSFLQTKEDTHKEGGEPPALENIDTSRITADPITPDIAERVRGSPEEVKLDEEAQKDKILQVTEDVIQCNANRAEKELLSNGSSANDSSVLKSLTDKGTESSENANSGTSSSGQRVELTKRHSQDPDPVWVLSLLKKLEKQFMSHYASAIAEFKVRWDLNDNETLDVMIKELEAEVHKRIQSTINRELQKIQGRAGRTPRPPLSTLSKDSSAQTEQRRRRLKVMQNKLIKPGGSEDMNTVSGTELSEQRSDDEYCPCDICIQKKMASRVVQQTEALSMAPVLMDFDLRKILQLKKDSLCATSAQCDLKEATDSSEIQEENNFEVILDKAEFQNTNDNTEGHASEDDQSTDGSLDKDKFLVFENQDIMLTNDEEGVEEQLFNAETKGREREKQETEKEGDQVYVVEIETETENLEVDKNKADKSTNNTGKNRTSAGAADGMADEATEGDTLLDAEEVVEEINETENSEGAEEGDLEEDKESTENIRAEKETSNEADEEGENTDKETSDEAELTESEQESESTSEGEQSENSNITSIKETRDEADKRDTTKSKSETSTEDNEDTNKSESAKTEDDDDEKPKAIRQAGDGVSEKEQLGTFVQISEQDVEQADVEEEEIDQQHQSMHEIENQAKEPAHNSPVNKDEDKDISSDEDVIEELKSLGQCENSDCRFIQQITKTSMESQPGSLENSKDLTGKEKLKDIHSFMESSGSS